MVAVKDPQVDGVTLYLSDFKRSVSAKLQSGDIFSEPSQTSLACVRDELAEGGVVIRGDLGGREGKEVFAERKNLNLLNNKTLSRFVACCTVKRHTRLAPVTPPGLPPPTPRDRARGSTRHPSASCLCVGMRWAEIQPVERSERVMRAREKRASGRDCRRLDDDG